MGIATVWPPVYMLLFILTVFSITAYFALDRGLSSRRSEDIDLIQLERKIRNGELSELTVKPTEVVAYDRSCDCEYRANVKSPSTRAEIIRLAREPDQNGVPRVPKVSEETSPPQVPMYLPIGFAALFGVHMLSVWLMLGLLPVYIILAVRRPQFDQTTRIVWIVLICLMGTYVMPVYWYLYVWRNQPAVEATSDSS